MRNFIKYYIAVFFTVIILFNPYESFMYAKSGLKLCSDVLAPSLFPFFVCSGLLIYSGFCEMMAKFLRPVMIPMFNVGGAGAAAFILGIISGYPLGAKTACNLYDSGYLSKTECERMLAFCNNSGPLFILGSVGIAIYHSPKAGIILYIAHILSALSVGFIFRFYKKNEIIATQIPIRVSDNSVSQAFQKSLSDSVNSILTVCGAVVFFSVISNIFSDYFSKIPFLSTVIISISELTSGINAISSSGLPIGEKLVLSAITAGFAGLCVHLQVMSVAAGKGLSLIPYIVGKICHGVLAGLYTMALLHFFPVTVEVFNNAGSVSGSFFASGVYTSICTTLLIIIGIIMLFFDKIKKIGFAK